MNVKRTEASMSSPHSISAAAPAPGRRRFIHAGGLAALGAMLPRGLQAAGPEVVVADYGGVTRDVSRRAFYDPFKAATGINVIEATTTGFAQLEAMVMASNVQWDVVASAEESMVIGAARNMLEPIDYSIVKTDGILPAAVHKYGLIKSYYAGVLAYSTKMPQAPKSWADFWNVTAFPGARGMRNAPEENVEFALLADGVAPNALYPLDLDRAFRKLDQIKPHVKVWWTSGAQSVQIIADGIVVMAPTWNGRVEGAREKNVPIDLVWNGALLIGAPYIVPKGAKNRENAMKFINFTMNPDRQADFAKDFYSGPAVPAALAKLSPEVSKRLPTNPENLKQMAVFGAQWYAENAQALTRRWEKWVTA
jgi:putative spermidine/putrescine transport system substrate-binding protein